MKTAEKVKEIYNKIVNHENEINILIKKCELIIQRYCDFPMYVTLTAGDGICVANKNTSNLASCRQVIDFIEKHKKINEAQFEDMAFG
jgi:hypothetical protein